MMQHPRLSLLLSLVIIPGMSSCEKQKPSPAPPAAPPPSAPAPAPPAGPVAAADNGCWVHIYEDENFGDNNDIIRTPGRYGNMRNLPGAAKTDWGDEIDSIKVGPRAQFTGWEDENFGDNRIDVSSGTERNNLRGDPDMGDQIDSMELRCL
jgi:hypothetical protein